MTDLTSFLNASGMTQQQFAARVGVDQSVISKIAREKARPGLDLAVAIERETDGAVTVSSWIAAPTETGA